MLKYIAQKDEQINSLKKELTENKQIQQKQSEGVLELEIHAGKLKTIISQNNQEISKL